ncbi:MAG: hypothetical protein LBS16_02255 [Prevotellaceae bacterium]|nr:hypothetical protein [Prevotellaceae bacterium]
MKKNLTIALFLFAVVNGAFALPKSKITEQLKPGRSEWTTESKHDFVYDKKGYIVSTIENWLNPYTSQWSPSTKTDYLYDNKHRRISEVFSHFYGPSNSWQQKTKKEYSYEADQCVALSYAFNNYVGAPEPWRLESKTVFVLKKGVKQSSETSLWNEDTQEYVLASKEIFVYDKKGNEIEYTSYRLVEGEWVVEWIVKSTYGAKNSLIEQEIDDHSEHAMQHAECSQSAKRRFIYQ